MADAGERSLVGSSQDFVGTHWKRPLVVGLRNNDFDVEYGEDASLGGEFAKSSNPSYSLFETLQIPPEILYPKYQQGLGVTWLTADGFVDEAN